MEKFELWLSIIGNAISIIGFGITIAVWFGVDSLRKVFVSRATIPNQLIALSELRDNFANELSGQFTNNSKENFSEMLAEAEANINNLSAKLKLLNRGRYRKLIEPAMGGFKSSADVYVSSPNKENARASNLQLLKLIRSIQYFVEDDSWRRIQ